MLDISTLRSMFLNKEKPDRIEKVTVGEFLFYKISDDTQKYEWACHELTNQGLKYLSSSSKWKNLSCEDVEDLVQESMIALISRLSAKNINIKIAAYFKGICKNKAFDMLNNPRKRSTISDVEENENYLMSISDEGKTSDDIFYNLFYEGVIEILERNSSACENFKYHDCLKILELRRQGYKHSEIDALLKKQKGWSKLRQTRCFKKIRAILGIVKRKVTIKK